jgi:protein gp37
MDRRFFGGRHWGSPKGTGALRPEIAGFEAAALKLNEQAATGKFRECPGCGFRGWKKDIFPIVSQRCLHRPESARPRVFPSSMDWLDEAVPAAQLAWFLDVVRRTWNLDWLLLTKRPEEWRRAMERLYWVRSVKLGTPLIDWVRGWMSLRAPDNIWVGTSVEDQQRAEERVPAVLKIPAKVRFLSVEPLLEKVDLKLAQRRRGAEEELGTCGIDWVIVGGESGPGARPCNVEWIRDIVRQCRDARVPCFVKQLGSRPYDSAAADGVPDAHKKFSGDEVTPEMVKIFNDCRRLMSLNLTDKKGGDPAEWPEDLRVREFPDV